MSSRGIVAFTLIAALSVAMLVAALNTSLAADAPQTEPSVTPPASARKIDFNRDIRPILSDNCYYCHGPDKSHRKADLRLDTKDGLFGVREDTYAIVPGKPDDSVLFMRITSDDADVVMPHKDSNKHLTPTQIALIKQWIEEGAEWKGHWSYIKPERPALPKVDAPKFVQNPIDNFIVDKFNEMQLSPSPEADRITLIRRLSFDILGLPPTPQEVDAFVNDKSPDAYDKLVDRLLASPHYGERMTVAWMDLVRYGDTVGFHSDTPREIWPWRDWCIKSFNDNKKFDDFTREQLAGDLVPNATREQKVGSGYNRLLLTTEEGGAQAKEYIAKYAGDRVRNVSTVWMGGTMGCAQCHDHKFDPYTAKDFYRLAAFFADLQEPAVAHPEPELLLPTPQQEAELARLNTAIAAVRKKIDTPTPELAAAQAKFEEQYQKEKEKDVIKWQPLEITEIKSLGGATMAIGKDKTTVLVSGINPPTDIYEIRALARMKNISGLKLEVLPHDSLPAGGPGRSPNGNFVLTEIDVNTETGSTPMENPVAFIAASASHEQAGDGSNPYHRFSAFATIDGDKYGPKWGWAILDKIGQASNVVYETPFNIGNEDRLVLNIKLKFNHGEQYTLGRFRFFLTDSPRPIRAMPDNGIPSDIAHILDIAPDKRNEKQTEQLAGHYRSIDPSLKPQRDELTALNKQLNDLIGPPYAHKYNPAEITTIPRTLISVSGPPRVTRVLARGNWQDDSGEIVSPSVPAFMKQIQLPPDRGASRLDLANWLVERDNPLTARVFVNRLWKMLYGAGIAKPLDDLGAQGEWPTHPELLDWLAVEFMDSGWDIKHMVRLMVTSGAYRQQSQAGQQLREKDPYNKWLARQGTFRLDAEFVRDNALAISGLLSSSIGGPGVKPYQPPGYWDFLNFPKRTYEQDHGESLYRRGMYTWWQRTFLNPSLLNFDAPSHEECTAERVRSNTPQQALTLLNDIVYVEAARVFAEHIIECGGTDPAERLKWAFRTALSREPKPEETPVLVALLEQQQQRYAADKKSAEALIATGEAPVPKDVDPAELAAWTSVARTILNLHETITRN